MKNKKVEIKMFKTCGEEKELFNNINFHSLALFCEMMADRFRNFNDDED